MHGQLPLAEAARRLGLSTVAARRRAQRGTLPASKVAGEWYGTVPDRVDRAVTQRAAHGTAQQAGSPNGKPGPDTAADTKGGDKQAVAALERVVRETLRRADEADTRARDMAAAAALWQERARNLESELERVLALPAHEVEAPSARWWHWWRRREQHAGA